MTDRLIENVDFYFDPNGKMVLTEEYHLKRGYCCGSGCRHCPFTKNQDPNVPSEFSSNWSEEDFTLDEESEED